MTTIPEPPADAVAVVAGKFVEPPPPPPHHIGVSQETVGKIRTKFEEEYGTADVDIQTGTINYPPENGEADKKD